MQTSQADNFQIKTVFQLVITVYLSRQEEFTLTYHFSIQTYSVWASTDVPAPGRANEGEGCLRREAAG